MDMARCGGHYYSDKAPGTAALALGPFILGSLAVKASGESVESPAGWLTTSWVTCAAVNAVPLAIGFTLLAAWLRRLVSARAALLTVLGISLGGMPLIYATALWSHSLVCGLICVAIWCLAPFTGDNPRPGRLGAAGVALGLALASEFTAGLVIAALCWHTWRNHRHRAVYLALGAIAPLLLIPAYNLAVTGSPFILPYSHQASFPEMGKGIYAIRWPDPETLGALLCSPERGLLTWCPFLLLAGVGYWQMLHDSPQPLWLTYAVPLLTLIVISGRVWDWQAGWCLGPRYLTPILPLLALPCALAARRLPGISAALAALSMLLVTQAVLTSVIIPDWYHAPLLQFHWPLWREGKLSPNLGRLAGLSPWASVAPFYLILTGGIWRLWRQAKALDTATAAPDHAALP